MNRAAFWVTRMQSTPLTEADHEQFDLWLGEDPNNAGEYAKALQTWRQLTVMRHSTQYGRLLGAPSWRERMVHVWHAPGLPLALTGSAAMLLLALVSVWLWTREYARRYHTGIAQVRTEILEDGTRVTLAPQSQVRTQYGETERRLVLSQGQIYVDVARESKRPFRVIAGDVDITALGTAFEVRKAKDVRVTVLEGKVSVASDSSITPIVLTAGQQTIASIQRGVEAPEPIQSKEPVSWRVGRLVYENAPLREIVSDANRYSHHRIVLEDAALGELKVTTSFLAGQVEVLVDTLEGALPVTVERRKGEIVLRSHAQKSDPGK